jgi:hypothetical protein
LASDTVRARLVARDADQLDQMSRAYVWQLAIISVVEPADKRNTKQETMES